MIVGEEGIHIKDLYYVMMKNQCGNVKECKTLIKHQKVFVNGQCIVKYDYPIKDSDEIIVNDKRIDAHPFVYYMFYKPKGCISASYDKNDLCVMDYIERKDCFCVGRLDKDTTGFLLVTNDAFLSKRLLLPQYHIDKKYLVEVNKALTYDLVDKFEKGIVIDKDVVCQSAVLKIIDDSYCYITITEGKYHQVKKMFLSCGYVVINLKRVSFAGIELDFSLKEGEYRELNDFELQILEKRILMNQ